MTETNQFNENNPTVNWTEDEKYEVCKWENKWLKELTKTRTNGSRNSGRVCDSVDDPTFATTDELNKTFQQDIATRKQTWKHLCHICDFATNHKSTLTGHLIVHGIGERYKCDQCDKDYSKKDTLKFHIESQHETVQKLHCQICQKGFSNKKSLNGHTKEIHEEKALPCDECSQIFGTVGSLNKHKKTVHVLNSFKCPQCNKKCKTQGNLNRHIRSIHEKENFSCNLCDYSTTQQGNLSGHVESVHENKKNFFCKACPFSCYHKGDFVRHMRIHTGEKPFQCNKCLARFSLKQSLQRHQNICTL